MNGNRPLRSWKLQRGCLSRKYETFYLMHRLCSIGFQVDTLEKAPIENSLDFEKKRIFTCGSNIYANPELLGGNSSSNQTTAGDAEKGGQFKQEVTAMRSIVGATSSTDCGDEIAFSILEDDQGDGKSAVSSSKPPENIKTINAKAGFPSCLSQKSQKYCKTFKARSFECSKFNRRLEGTEIS